MLNRIKLMMPILATFTIIGLILLLSSGFIKDNKIDLYNVDFNKFEFKKHQVYKYEIEIVGNYFYKRIPSGRRHTTYYYYNAKVKNKYSDDIYVVCELNSASRTNMIKSGNKIIDRTGEIRSISKKMKESYQRSLNNLDDNIKTYDIYFVLSTKDILKLLAVLFLAFPVFMIIFIIPISCLVNKKKEV